MRTIGSAGLACLAALLLLPGCGGGGSSPTAASTPAPGRTVIGEFSFIALPSPGLNFGEVTVSGAGTLEAVAEWTFASNDIDLYLTNGSCDATAFVAERCTVITSATGLSKPERITAAVQAGVYRAWVVNFGPGPESGTIQVFLTRS